MKNCEMKLDGNILRVGFETRDFVDNVLQSIPNKKDKLKICVQALCDFLLTAKDAIDPTVVLLLSFETINGMSKIAPMTVKRLN